jgi:hypothetical protein
MSQPQCQDIIYLVSHSSSRLLPGAHGPSGRLRWELDARRLRRNTPRQSRLNWTNRPV